MEEEESEGTSLLDLGADSVSREDLDDTGKQDPDAFTDKYRESVALDQVRSAVRQYGEDGISVSMVADLLDMANETVRKHLETLCSLREVYKQKKNKQMYLYYPNGKPLHGLGTRRIESDDGETIIEMQLAQGRNDQLMVHVTESRFSLLEGERTEGAIMFPLDNLDEFFAELTDLADEVEQE